MDDWRTELDAVLARALTEAPAEEVARLLVEAAGRLGAEGTAGSGPEPLHPETAVLGVVPCEAGWVGVAIGPAGRATVHVGAKVVSVVEQVRETGPLAAVGIDAGAELPTGTWIVGVEVLRVDPERIALGPAGREQLGARGLTVPAFYAGSGFAEEDLLRAGAAVLVLLGRTD